MPGTDDIRTGEAGGNSGETQNHQEKSSNGFEDRARAKGWKPKEEFDGDQNDWVDAEEFVKREPLFEKIRNQSKELKEMRKTVDAMATHFQKSVKAEVDRTLRALQAERKEAIELGDVEKVEKLDEKIEEQKQVVAETKQQAVPRVPQEVEDWVGKNKWFNDSPELREFAIVYNNSYMKNNPGKTLTQCLDETEKAVKRAFPDNFKAPENERRNEPPPVEGGGTSKAGSAKGYNINRLSQDQRRVYDQMVVKHKILKHDEYFAGLEEIGELA